MVPPANAKLVGNETPGYDTSNNYENSRINSTIKVLGLSKFVSALWTYFRIPFKTCSALRAFPQRFLLLNPYRQTFFLYG
jgi:hypothetical protein